MNAESIDRDGEVHISSDGWGLGLFQQSLSKVSFYTKDSNVWRAKYHDSGKPIRVPRILNFFMLS